MILSYSSFAQTGAHSGGQTCWQGGMTVAASSWTGTVDFSGMGTVDSSGMGTVGSSGMDTADSSGTSGARRAKARWRRRRVVPKVSFMMVFVICVVLVSALVVV